MTDSTHRATAKRSVRSTILGVLSATLLAAASVFGFASAAQAAWVSPEDLETSDNWGASNGWNDEIGEPVPYTFTECAIQLPMFATLYIDPADERWSFTELETFIESLSINISSGTGELWLIIDYFDGDDGSGIADFGVMLTVGEHGINPTDTVEYDGDDLGIGNTPTLQELLDALEATGAEFLLLDANFSGAPDAEVQWVAFNGQVHWFGTNATWFTDDPTCGAVQPTRPDVVQTAAK